MSRTEYENIKNQQEPNADKKELTKKVEDYCRNNYKKVADKRVIKKRETVCMRENSFYVDTIRDFRNLRYSYKSKAKINYKMWKNETRGEEERRQAQQSFIYYNSLQVAYKIILNSFYGYVMKKGARWYSMEMAGMVTFIGSQII